MLYNLVKGFQKTSPGKRVEQMRLRSRIDRMCAAMPGSPWRRLRACAQRAVQARSFVKSGGTATGALGVQEKQGESRVTHSANSRGQRPEPARTVLASSA